MFDNLYFLNAPFLELSCNTYTFRSEDKEGVLLASGLFCSHNFSLILEPFSCDVLGDSFGAAVKIPLKIILKRRLYHTLCKCSANIQKP